MVIVSCYSAAVWFYGSGYLTVMLFHAALLPLNSAPRRVIRLHYWSRYSDSL